MFFAKIPRHTSQNAITEGDLECILNRNCEGTEQLQIRKADKIDKKRDECKKVHHMVVQNHDTMNKTCLKTAENTAQRFPT